MVDSSDIAVNLSGVLGILLFNEFAPAERVKLERIVTRLQADRYRAGIVVGKQNVEAGRNRPAVTCQSRVK